MSLLHTVNKSPFASDALDSCLAHRAPGAALLLIEDGVYAALAAAGKLVGQPHLYALRPDLEARGLAGRPLVAGLTVVGYDGFVDLCAAHSAVQSWF